jgi:hypothetical protein
VDGERAGGLFRPRLSWNRFCPLVRVRCAGVVDCWSLLAVISSHH